MKCPNCGCDFKVIRKEHPTIFSTFAKCFLYAFKNVKNEYIEVRTNGYVDERYIRIFQYIDRMDL